MQEVENLKIKGQYREAGALAYELGLSGDYGCHYGMRSDRAQAIAEFQEGWDEATQAPAFTVTGRVWNAATRRHDKLTEVTFERRVDAICFMNVNREWIAGMVLDMNRAARELPEADTRLDGPSNA